jgi:proline dehydrogenase
MHCPPWRAGLSFREWSGPIQSLGIQHSFKHVHHEPKSQPSLSLTRTARTYASQPMKKPSAPPLSILPLGAVVRSLFVTTISSVPVFLGPALATLSFLANSKSALLNPDRNRILSFFLRKTLYAQFCAGENPPAVRSYVKELKDMGYSGVILGYGKEVVMDEDEASAVGTQIVSDKDDAAIRKRNSSEVLAWKDGNMKTVDLADDGDFVALKFTGAGRQALSHLIHGLPPSPEFEQAIVDICDRARERNARLLFDAEQQAVQHTIDSWVLQFQRRYNSTFKLRGKPRALVYGTYQAYLLSTPATLAHHLAVAEKEGFVLGVKLVRGAYLGTDPRHLFWETKEGTDTAYDSIAASLITRQYGTVLKPASSDPAHLPTFPQADLVLASHNRQSVEKARALRTQQAQSGQSLIAMVYGQLQGMADDISCRLVQDSQLAKQNGATDEEAPRPYKYLVWGTVGECTKYLLRRGHENRDAASRTKDTRRAMFAELKRRASLGLLSSNCR